MKHFLLLFMGIAAINLAAQISISEIEGYLEVYHPIDSTSIYIGIGSGSSLDADINSLNTCLGYHSGRLMTTGRSNTLFGGAAGSSISSAHSNSFFGRAAGVRTTTGSNNCFFGRDAGLNITTGHSNCFFGVQVGADVSSGSRNSIFGHFAGQSNLTGEENSYFGYQAGKGIHSGGSNNICVGFNAGPFSANGVVSNQLYIDVQQSNTPLIYGEFDNNLLQINGLLSAGVEGSGNALFKLNTERPWIFKQHSSGATTALELTLEDANNANKNFIIDTDGNVGIDTHTPGFKLHVNGSAGKPGGGSWSNASDERLKTNVTPFKDGLELIAQLNPVNFHYNGLLDLPSDREYVGIIAQELLEVAPYMVSEMPASNGERYLHVDPSAFDFILINAVKELMIRIENLESIIDEQRKIIQDAEAH